jgi:hypothetical protein
MQLLNSNALQTSDIGFDKLLSILQDIVSKLEIQSNFYIYHPDYKTLKFSDAIVARFQQVPLNLQHKFLSSQLRSFLYSIYYNGALRTVLAIDSNSLASKLLENLENNSFLGVDVDFFNQLRQSNTGEGYFDHGWHVLKEDSSNTLVVKKDGLTLYIQRDRHLLESQKCAIPGDVVAIKLPPNIIQNGFFMAIGNQGRYSSVHSGTRQQIVRIYFNLSPQGAVEVMYGLTRQLNDISIPFSFKALYNPSDYERYDTAVLYFEKSNYPSVHQVLQSVYNDYRLHFSEEVPLFTKLLAPGLALAEEPNNKFAEKESFGTHRCQIVANALVEAWHQGDESTDNRTALILKHFAQQGIELQHPYLNPDSENIYTALDY